jgi:hypothetical protein
MPVASQQLSHRRTRLDSRQKIILLLTEHYVPF